ncbi:hypothetical protein J2W15_002529 [Pseudarthrobacter sulfonivorans]|nr:hypothetical protein [Pseudarthrobacter sulfonivorans]
MRYQDPSWWQIGLLYLICGTIFWPPLSTNRMIAGIVFVAIVTVLLIFKIIRGRSSTRTPGPPHS